MSPTVRDTLVRGSARNYAVVTKASSDMASLSAKIEALKLEDNTLTVLMGEDRIDQGAIEGNIQT